MKSLTNLFSRLEISSYAIFSVVIVSVVVTTYMNGAASYQRKLDIEFAERLSTKLSGELGHVAGIMNSASSVQQILDDPYSDQLDSFALNSIEDSRLINTMARYERVTKNEIEPFIQNMAESGLYNYKITELNSEGVRGPAKEKSVYYPIIWKQPFNPITGAMLGLDISSNSEIDALISRSEAANTIEIIERPENWNFAIVDDLLFFAPTYFGRYAPLANSRVSAPSNGGVIVGVNLTDYIRTNEVLKPGYDLTISINSSDNNFSTFKPVSFIRGKKQVNRRLSNIFEGFAQTWAPFPGNQRLRLLVTSHGGVEKQTLVNAGLLALLSSVILLIGFCIFYQVRKKDAAHRRDRETALTTLRAIGDAVITANVDGSITYVNPSAEGLLARSGENVMGLSIAKCVEIAAADSRGTFGLWQSELTNAMENSSGAVLPELQLLESGDNPVYLSSSVSPLGKDDSDGASGSVLVLRDVTAERQLTRELEFQATHDSLTGISNRYRFEQELESLFDSSKNEGKSHAVCYIDLDQFKTINDTCGHSAGDKLLVRVSRGLEAKIRKNDILARLGGDEFGLLIVDCSYDDAIGIAERVFGYFQSLYFQHDDDVFAVRASIGVVHVSGQFDNIEDIMAAADLACYAAKDHGRNELHIYDHQNDETTDRMSEMMWLPKLQMALRRDSFRLFAQPIVRMSSDGRNEINYEHYEVLLRLQTESGDLITPAQLIVAAERYNLMKEIDRWVIQRAISFLSDLNNNPYSQPLKLSINISGQSSTDPDLPQFIEDEINRAKIDPACLVFEITETAAITNMQSAVKLVDFLHELGCKVALDDFGSGVSSFGYLKSIPVDYIKIDGQFIKNIDTNDVDREMVKCMQAVANILGIEMVAEFVETKEVVEVLRGLNVEFAQGYYYSKPHPIEDLLQYDYMDKAA